MNNPLTILQTLDGFLHSPFELIVYGRSALALGYPNPPQIFAATMDVDAILPAKDLEAIEANEDFWQAQEKTNQILDDTGLYFTHLFEEKQVILTPDWQTHTVEITDLMFSHIRLKRPSTEDLILTKMMRIDPQDREDILYLMSRNDFYVEKLERALQNAICPDVDEIREAFTHNSNWILKNLP